MSKDIFESLIPLGPRLDEASREANDVLKRAKERLAEISLGVEAWVTIHWEGDGDSFESDVTYETRFGYARRVNVQGESQPASKAYWDLLITHVDACRSEGYHHADGPYRVLECSRDIRIASARAIPALVEAIQREAENAISEINQTAKKLA
jgi:hypothetical protein